MATSGAVGREPPLHWIQRTLDSITFVVLLGVFFPTGLYTVWSVIELQRVPQFGASPHGALHGSSTEAAAAATRVTDPMAAAATGPTASVTMKDLAFSPRTLEVAAGTTVTWRNDDAIDHAVASGTPETPVADRLIEGSGDFGPGGTFSFTFERPGTYEIHCSTPGHFAAGMTMTVIVTEAAR